MVPLVHFRKHLILIFISLLLTSQGQGQANKYGVPLITNYTYDVTGGSEQNWCVTQDHRGVVYVGNNDKKILEYDGVDWRSIEVPDSHRVRSLLTGSDGIVYVGADGDFGMLIPDGKGLMHFHSLCDSSIREIDPGFVTWKTYEQGNLVHFVTFDYIYTYDKSSNEVSYRETSDTPFFTYFVNNREFHLNYADGLMEYADGKYELLPGGDFFREMSVLNLDNYDSARVLVGDFYGLYLYNPETGEIDRSFPGPQVDAILASSGIPFMQVKKDHILVGTQFNNGLLILDRNGEIREMITENEGLKDQTIAHAYSAGSEEGAAPLWIAHWRGVSKLELNSPFRVFTEDSGFEGLINNICYYNSTLFISTDQGVYYLKAGERGSRFHHIPEIQVHIWDMHVYRARNGQQYLLATTNKETYIIDHQMRVRTLSQLIVNPPEDAFSRDQYGGRTIATDMKDPSIIYTGDEDVVGIQYSRGRWEEVLRITEIQEEILRIELDNYGYLWVTTETRVLRVDLSIPGEFILEEYETDDGLPLPNDNLLLTDFLRNEVLMATGNGFYRFDYLNESFVPDTLLNSVLPEGTNKIQNFHVDKDGDYWMSFENSSNGWTELVVRPSADGLEIISEAPFQRLPNAQVDAFQDDEERGVWFSKADELYHFNKDFSPPDSLSFRCLIRNVVIDNGDSVLYHGTNFAETPFDWFTVQLTQPEDTQPVLSYRHNNLEFHWASPYFEQEKSLVYSYKLLGLHDDWSEWQPSTFTQFTNLKYGRYTMKVKARNVYGQESIPASYSFMITRPWYATYVAFLGYLILSGLLIYIIIRLYTQRLKNENIRLEGIIQERTAEILKQKEELTDSIEYASRIQRALLPSDHLMVDKGIEHFILFRPRDIVSGDFYWIAEKNNKLLIVAADCTGHGVPGAFMSMLGMTFLDEIVIKSEITNTETIMESLREHVITSLEQRDSHMDDEVKDGMDLAMISIDLETGDIQYSGAYNPLYLVRKLKRSEKNKLNKGESLDLPRGSIHNDVYLLEQIRADQMPIGRSEKTLPFSSTQIKNQDCFIYMFSDGYVDQFGGPQGKKLMSKNFKKLLLDLQGIPLSRQGEELEKNLLEWMGEINQIDDILVMGLRINLK